MRLKPESDPISSKTRSAPNPSIQVCCNWRPNREVKLNQQLSSILDPIWLARTVPDQEIKHPNLHPTPLDRSVMMIEVWFLKLRSTRSVPHSFSVRVICSRCSNLRLKRNSVHTSSQFRPSCIRKEKWSFLIESRRERGRREKNTTRKTRDMSLQHCSDYSVWGGSDWYKMWAILTFVEQILGQMTVLTKGFKADFDFVNRNIFRFLS